MSFSLKVKNEICRQAIEDDCCLWAELSAVLQISGSVTGSGSVAGKSDSEVNVKVTTENAAFARRLFSQIKKAGDIVPEVVIRRNKKLKKHITYIVVVTAQSGAALLLEKAKAGRGQLKKTCCKKAFLRGAFLAGGAVSDPEKTYHLEITAHSKKTADDINAILGYFKLNAKIIQRKGNYVVYLKEGENIVDFLNVVGAHNALMELENVGILKGMRTDVNRLVNCETANLEKTVNASVRQAENINYIFESIGIENIPKNLREIAELRLEHPDASLAELGQLLKPPLGKSGANHRLRKLEELAEKDRKLKGKY